MMKNILCLLLMSACALSTTAQETLNLPAGTEIAVTTLSRTVQKPIALQFDSRGGLYTMEHETGRVFRLSKSSEFEAVGVVTLPASYVDGEMVRAWDIAFLPSSSGMNDVMSAFITVSTSNNSLLLLTADVYADRLGDISIVREFKNVPVSLGGYVEITHAGTLLVSVGNFDDDTPSDVSTPNGKILCIDRMGNPAVTNPMNDGGADMACFVYSYGHRQPKRVVQISATHPTLSSAVYEVEPGANGASEINRLQPGANHGWRFASGYCEDEAGSFVCPKATFPHIPSSLSFYNSDAIPEWQHSMLIGSTDLYGGLFSAKLDENGNVTNIDISRGLDDVLDLSEEDHVYFEGTSDLERIFDIAVDYQGRVYLALQELDGEQPSSRIVVLENLAVHTPVSVDNIESNTSITCSPNPFDNSINVATPETVVVGSTIRVINLLGVTVAQTQASAHGARATIQTAHLPSGSYLVVVETTSGIQTVPIVK